MMGGVPAACPRALYVALVPLSASAHASLYSFAKRHSVGRLYGRIARITAIVLKLLLDVQLLVQ